MKAELGQGGAPAAGEIAAPGAESGGEGAESAQGSQ